MKKSVMLAILGAGLAVTGTTAYGQGGISIGNYQPPYNAVVWSGGPRDGQGVLSTEGVNLTLWYGAGNLSAGALSTTLSLPWSTVNEGNGFPGYYATTLVTLPGWTAGSTYTFQVRATGNATGQSVTWTESANIKDISGTPPGPAGISSQSIGFTVSTAVPEPTTFALVGLGAAGLMMFRRRLS